MFNGLEYLSYYMIIIRNLWNKFINNIYLKICKIE